MPGEDDEFSICCGVTGNNGFRRFLPQNMLFNTHNVYSEYVDVNLRTSFSEGFLCIYEIFIIRNH